MRIAIVIPTLNRCDLLKETLASLGKVNGIRSESAEVVVIDNGSSDDTKRICDENLGPIPGLTYIYDPRPGLHVGRNRGWTETTAEVVAYLDDDVLLDPRWLEGVLNAFSNPEVMLVGGPVIPLFRDAAPGWLVELWEQQPPGQRVLGELSIIDFGERCCRISSHHVFGCNFAIRRSVLEQARGFHPDGMPKAKLRFRGDGESYISNIIQERGGYALYHAMAGIRHQVTKERMTQEYFQRRWYAQGISDSYTDLRANPSFRQRLKRHLGIIKNLSQAHIGAKQLNSMQRCFRRAWARGYWFHQLEALRDRRLREWIRRVDYLGANSQLPG